MGKGTKYVPKTRLSLRQAEKAIREGITDEEFANRNTALTKDEIDELKMAAIQLKESRDYIAEVAAKERFSTDTFRSGYIGKKVSTLDGSEFVQITRGRPYGYLAAVLGADGKTIYSGFTYVSENEKYPHSVIGQAIALRRAIENREKGNDIEMESKSPYLKSSDELQFEHFKNRVKRYFRPDEYSYSRGKEPLAQPNFDEVHIWQYLMLAKSAKTKKERKDWLKKVEELMNKIDEDKKDKKDK